MTCDDTVEYDTVYNEIKAQNETRAREFWESLSYEDKCNAFHAVVERLVDGELRRGGSYRYILYDVFGFTKEMYTRGIDCGFLALHNSITREQVSCISDASGASSGSGSESEVNHE